MSTTSYRERVWANGADRYTIGSPRYSRTGKFGAVLLHGAATPDEYTGAAGWPKATHLKAALGRAGIPFITHTLSGDTYANDASMTQLDTLRALLQAQTGTDVSKVHLFGTSMGAGIATRYAIQNPTRVASVQGIIPMASIPNLYRQNPTTALSGGFTNGIATAWGLSFTLLTVTLTNGSTAMVATVGSFTAAMAPTYLVVKNIVQRYPGPMDTTIPFGTTVAAFTDATHATLSAPFTGTTGSYQIAVVQPLPAGADLVAQAPTTIRTAAIPGRLFYSTVDPYIDPADVQALATAAGWSAVAIDSAAGHTNGSLAALAAYNSTVADFSDVLQFMAKYGA